MKITLKEIPYKHGDENALNYCDVGGDRNFEIVADGTYTVGHCYISEDTETNNGIPCKAYLDWIEFFSIFRNRHLLRPTLDAICDMFGDIYFESSEKALTKYRHIGCESQGISECTELEIFKYSKAA